MEYPCKCKEMMWMVDNNKVFNRQDDRWLLTWIELDKTNSGVNVEQFGVVIYNCMFCGEKIKSYVV